MVEELTSTGVPWVILFTDEATFVFGCAFACGNSEVGGGEVSASLVLEVLGTWYTQLFSSKGGPAFVGSILARVLEDLTIAVMVCAADRAVRGEVCVLAEGRLGLKGGSTGGARWGNGAHFIWEGRGCLEGVAMWTDDS